MKGTVMVSLSKGVLKIKYTAFEKARLFYEIAFVLNMVVIFAGYSTEKVASVTALILFVASCWVLFEKNRNKIIIPYVSVWYLIFIIYIGFSNLWASDFIGVDIVKLLLRYLIILLSTTSVAIYVDDAKDLDKIIDLFILSTLIIIALELSATPMKSLNNGNLGWHYSHCNPNDITVWMDFAATASFYKAYNKGKKWMYLVTVIMVIFCALSSSRKGFAAAVIGPFMIVLFSFRKRGYVLRVILAVALAVGAAVLIMKNEVLYNAIGVRFEKLLTYIQGGKVDTSAKLRMYYIESAKSMFEESPILGKGIENFRVLMDKIYSSDVGYAHNNYWQVLSELGVIGFALYYGMYVFLACVLLKSYFVRRNNDAVLFIASLVMMLILEAGIVSIDSKFSQLIIAIIYCATYAFSSNAQHSEEYQEQ